MPKNTYLIFSLFIFNFFSFLFKYVILGVKCDRFKIINFNWVVAQITLATRISRFSHGKTFLNRASCPAFDAEQVMYLFRCVSVEVPVLPRFVRFPAGSVLYMKGDWRICVEWTLLFGRQFAIVFVCEEVPQMLRITPQIP